MTDLRPAVAQAIAELDAEHHIDIIDPEGCRICWPKDPSWPCVTRQVADDLRAALGEGDDEYQRIGWLHPDWSNGSILSDENKATLERRAPEDPTYTGPGFVAVYIAKKEATDE